MLLRCCILIPFLWLFLCSNSVAQRIFATVDATSIDESLRFDVNNIPVDIGVKEYFTLRPSGRVDLNYSPNIVFSDDSTKAFVSYSGSDTVLVFDPYSGEIIKLIEVCLIK